MQSTQHCRPNTTLAAPWRSPAHARCTDGACMACPWQAAHPTRAPRPRRRRVQPYGARPARGPWVQTPRTPPGSPPPSPASTPPQLPVPYPHRSPSRWAPSCAFDRTAPICNTLNGTRIIQATPLTLPSAFFGPCPPRPGSTRMDAAPPAEVEGRPQKASLVCSERLQQGRHSSRGGVGERGGIFVGGQSCARAARLERDARAAAAAAGARAAQQARRRAAVAAWLVVGRGSWGCRGCGA